MVVGAAVIGFYTSWWHHRECSALTLGGVASIIDGSLGRSKPWYGMLIASIRIGPAFKRRLSRPFKLVFFSSFFWWRGGL